MKKINLSKIAWAIAISIASGVALVAAAWMVVLPAGLVEEKILAAMKQAGVNAGFEGFGKGLFFSVHADLMYIEGKDGATILEMEDLKVSVSPVSLLKLSPAVDLLATVSGGKVEARVQPASGGQVSATLTASRVGIEGLGLERKLVGLRAKGLLEVEATMLGERGQVRFKATEMEFLPYSYMGFSLPLDLLRKGRGLVIMEQGMASVESAAFEGEGIYARASGTIGGGKTDMKLELMPSEDLENSQPYFRLLGSFRKTEGHYVIPLKRVF